MDMPQHKSWEITGPDVAAELLSWINVTPEDCQLLGSLYERAKERSMTFAQDFAGRILAAKQTAEYIAPYPLDVLAKTLANWFIELFSGTYDLAYAEARIRIGQVHVRLGLPVRYPIAMFDLVTRHGEQVAAAGGQTAVEAFRKILSLDIAVFSQAYEENQLTHLANVMGNERLARMLLMKEL